MNHSSTILKISGLSKTFAGSKRAAVHDFGLEVAGGQIVALLGESGCGKTTILRMIAGFEVPDSGTVIIGTKEVCSPKTFVQPEKRGVGIVFQDYALFPHKSVEENISYGLFRHRRPERKKIAQSMMELCGLRGLEKRYPHQISGGQRQRVALARALAPKPNIILFDEPFSNIDTMRKNQMRTDIEAIIKQTGMTAIFVTHDTRDVLAMADSVVVMRQGIGLQTGHPAEIYNRPKNQYVASFFGRTNLLSAITARGGYQTSIGFLATENNRMRSVARVVLSIRPEQWELISKPEAGCFSGRIISENFSGEHKEVVCQVNRTDGTLKSILIYAPAHLCFENNICLFRLHPGIEPAILEEEP